MVRRSLGTSVNPEKDPSPDVSLVDLAGCLGDPLSFRDGFWIDWHFAAREPRENNSPVEELCFGGLELTTHTVEEFERVVAGVGLHPLCDASEPCDPRGQLLDDRFHRLCKPFRSWEGGSEPVDKLERRLVHLIMVAAA